MDESRRLLLRFGAVTGGAVLVGAALDACGERSGLAKPDGRDVSTDAWLRIEKDGRLTILVDRSEMGQGIMTTLATLVAEELDVDLGQVAVEFATGRPEYVNPMFEVQITSASSSVRLAWLPLRWTGAAARSLFVEAAASLWGIDPSGCHAERGTVFAPSFGRRADYAELVTHLPSRPHGPVTLKDRSNFRLIGRPLPRLDTSAKTDGSAVFGMDVRMPGLLTAVVARAPHLGARLTSFDAASTLARPGIRHVVRIPGGVAVVADTFWRALKGRDQALRAEWSTPANPIDSAGIERLLADAAGLERGRVVRSAGDCRRAEQHAWRTVTADYSVPFQAHAPLEPMNATADVRADRCTVWAPTQNPGGARLIAAQVTGLSPDQVTVFVTYLGGSFGRRQEIDFVAEAVEISKQVGAPVKVVWTREDDMTHDFYRPAALCRMVAAIDGKGSLVSWRHRVASTSIWKRIVPVYAGLRFLRWLEGPVRVGLERSVGKVVELGEDPNLAEGAAEMPYAIPNVRIDYVDVDVGVPVGAWRSVGHSYNVFAVESFVDEIAAALGADACALRRGLMTASPRLRAALDLLAREAGWDRRGAEAGFLGIAAYDYLGTAVAMMARVRFDAQRLLRLVGFHCVVDCGIVVNPAIARAQVEGAVCFGLGAALKHQITWTGGAVVQRNFDTWPLPRLNEMPEVDVRFVDSDRPPSGLGEAATPGVAPALCNAVFAATGRRIRRLPFDLAMGQASA